MFQEDTRGALVQFLGWNQPHRSPRDLASGKIVREGVSITTMQGDPLIDKLNTWIDAAA